MLSGHYLIIYSLKGCKRCSGTCVQGINSRLQSNSTLSSFRKLLSIYRYQVILCWNDSGEHLSPVDNNLLNTELLSVTDVVYVALGWRIYDYSRMPEGSSLSHVIEYSRDHLQWQIQKAGFKDCHIELCQTHHSATNPVFRIVSLIGYPLLLISRFRDNLLAIAHAP